MEKKTRKIKAWTLSCSWNCVVIKAFQDKEKASEWLKEVRKGVKEDGLKCTHKLIPCTITLNPSVTNR